MPMLVHLTRLVRRAGSLLLDEVAPRHCPGCGELAGAGVFCPLCRQDLIRRPAPLCDRCGAPRGLRRARCREDHAGIAGLAFVRAPLRYQGTGGATVRRLKFAHDLLAARWLARVMAAEVAQWARGDGRHAVVTSVPLHARKRRQRGLDQAALLAELIARELDLRALPELMQRTRETLPQADPRVASRASNVAGAFAVRRRRAGPPAQVLLIDDVRTSGATARECARVLRAAGVREVALLTAAQA